MWSKTSPANNSHFSNIIIHIIYRHWLFVCCYLYRILSFIEHDIDNRNSTLRAKYKAMQWMDECMYQRAACFLSFSLLSLIFQIVLCNNLVRIYKTSAINAMQRWNKQTETVSCKQVAMSMSNRQSQWKQFGNKHTENSMPVLLSHMRSLFDRLLVAFFFLQKAVAAVVASKMVTTETTSNEKNVILLGNIAISSSILLKVLHR